MIIIHPVMIRTIPKYLTEAAREINIDDNNRFFKSLFSMYFTKKNKAEMDNATNNVSVQAITDVSNKCLEERINSSPGRINSFEVNLLTSNPPNTDIEMNEIILIIIAAFIALILNGRKIDMNNG
jgi:hypothetical protein